jgi:hypothetical protein
MISNVVLHDPFICVCARLLHTLTRDRGAHARFRLYILVTCFSIFAKSQVLANELKFVFPEGIMTCYFIYIDKVQHACMLTYHVLMLQTFQNIVDSDNQHSGRPVCSFYQINFAKYARIFLYNKLTVSYSCEERFYTAAPERQCFDFFF